MAQTQMTSRAHVPPLEPFVPAGHSLRVELAENNPTFPSPDVVGPTPSHGKRVFIICALPYLRG